MSVKKLSAAVLAIALGTCTFTTQASDDAGHKWVPKQHDSQYWQAPNWPGFNAQRPARPAPPPAYRARNPENNSPAANVKQTPPPPAGPYRSAPAPRPAPAPKTATAPRSAPPVPNRAMPAPPPRRAYNEPSAFNTPGYNRSRNYRRNNSSPWGGNRWGGNKFWGRSGPSSWMNPSKRNWENSWDDMINAPSRMGEMPGGWTAPEVSVPNPIDMGDQAQDNMRDLPDQMRDGNIGNDISD